MLLRHPVACRQTEMIPNCSWWQACHRLVEVTPCKTSGPWWNLDLARTLLHRDILILRVCPLSALYLHTYLLPWPLSSGLLPWSWPRSRRQLPRPCPQTWTWTIRKTCHFVFDYNFFFVDFYTFCVSGNRKEYSTKVNKIYHFTLHHVSTLPGKTKTMYKQHILKSIITVRSIEPILHNFRRKSTNVRIFQFMVWISFISLLAEKLSHLWVFFLKNFFRVIFKLNVFNFEI